MFKPAGSIAKLFFICFIGLVSCSEKGSYKRKIGRLISSEIVFPDTTCLLTKTSEAYDLKAVAKMVVYFDAETCASCALSRIWKWDEMSKITERSDGRFQTVFIFTPEKDDVSMVERIVSRMNMERRIVYVDRNSSFRTNNPFIPEEPLFHTFLVNQKNNIVLVGDPTSSAELWKLYEETINGLIGK